MGFLSSKGQTVRETLRRFCAANEGTTAIEYSVLSGGIALAILLTIGALGDATLAKYQLILNGVLH
jgi:Flp pilus assembly pilin Flp